MVINSTFYSTCNLANKTEYLKINKSNISFQLEIKKKALRKYQTTEEAARNCSRNRLL